MEKISPTQFIAQCMPVTQFLDEEQCNAPCAFSGRNICRGVALKKLLSGNFTDDVQEVERLIGKHVAGIGKKVSRGYGMFDHFNIQQLPYDPFDGAVIRPIPFKKGDFDGGNVTVQYRAYTFPYWLPENFVPCIVARKP